MFKKNRKNIGISLMIEDKQDEDKTLSISIKIEGDPLTLSMVNSGIHLINWIKH